MGQQRDFLAQPRQVEKRAHGHIYLVADAVAVHQHLRRILVAQRPRQFAYHCGPFLGIITLILRHAFTPLNNNRLGHLCGPMDEHLRTIEDALQVRIGHRQEHFRVEGPKAKAARALEVLQALYETAGRTIPRERVQLMLSNDAPLEEDADGSPVLQTRRSDLKARTPNQAVYLENITNHDITFGIGPAGTGKTYLAVACAVDALERNAVQRIVLTRPAVAAGEKLGFLPGDLSQKVDPYLRPLYDALYELMGFDKVTKAFERQ